MEQTYISSVSSDNLSKENICGWIINPLLMQKWGEALHFFLADLTSYVSKTVLYLSLCLCLCVCVYGCVYFNRLMVSNTFSNVFFQNRLQFSCPKPLTPPSMLCRLTTRPTWTKASNLGNCDSRDESSIPFKTGRGCE